MTQIDVSRAGADITNVVFHQTGSNRINTFFSKPFLNESEKYICGVSGLTVPMLESTMLNGAELGDLFYIYRRNAGEDIGAAAHKNLDGDGAVGGATLPQELRDNMPQASVGTFHCRAIPINNVQDFLVVLKGFTTVFAKRQGRNGINPIFYGATAVAQDGTTTPIHAEGLEPIQGAFPEAYSMLEFGLTPSGAITVNLSVLFANHFFLQFTEMGKTMFGLQNSLIAVTMGAQAVTRFGEGLTADGGLTGNMLPANVTAPVTVYGNTSLLNTLEGRLSIHVETSIPIKRTVVSENALESTAFDICSFSLLQKTSSSIDFVGKRLEEMFSYNFPSFSGQLVLQNQSTPPSYYTHVLDVLDLRTMQFRLYMRIKQYNATSKKWEFKTVDFPVSESATWSMNLRFVSL